MKKIFDWAQLCRRGWHKREYNRGWREGRWSTHVRGD